MLVTEAPEVVSNDGEDVHRPIRVLLIEDDIDDFLLTWTLLDRVPGALFSLEWTDSYETGLAALRREAHDVCLLDCQLGARTGLELLTAAAEFGCRTPILLLTGVEDRDTDLAALRAGAAEYLVKQEITGPVLERALRYARQRAALLEEIRRLSVTDELTGLKNRRGFHLLGSQRIREYPADTQVLLMYADLDGLKSINDQFGHEAGDRAIQAVGSVLSRAFRASDVIARLGGDEFVVLAVDVPLHAERDIAWRIRHHLAAQNLAWTPAFELSISFGFVRHVLSSTLSLTELVAEADARMYEEKSARRRQREVARAPVPQPSESAA
ncbi:GGDEF domain-containing protein [Gemmatimonas groenlandica]|uniref:diguanylate cyclase n=1 Tax=Gemmatimonas groenlandica TaxID=2732249 RepID=A0A6M4IUW4_9BACT|nr:GGDEF domain-containing response regulator [Gemmatimonas groenlandica]QJR35951.1 GGDEF domain-containing response regulator [Gemmatimonas groenlandica]